MLYIARVTITLQEDMLGTVPLNKEIYSEYMIGQRAELLAKELKQGIIDQREYTRQLTEIGREVETVRDDKGKTGFHRDPLTGAPVIYDYMMKGFIKAAADASRQMEGSLSLKMTSYLKRITQLLHPAPRLIPFILADPTLPLAELQRPLRAQTAQGERVALASSEVVPAGSQLKFNLQVLNSLVISEPLLREWLDFGQFVGLGQWRGAGWGRFTYEMTI